MQNYDNSFSLPAVTSSPLWKRGARGDLCNNPRLRAHAKIPFHPPLPRGKIVHRVSTVIATVSRARAEK